MAFKKGQAKMGGRKKGTPNKITEVKETLEKHGFDPVEKMIFCYNEAMKIYLYRKKKKNDYGAMGALQTAANIAEDLCQYAHPKLKAVEHSGKNGENLFASLAELAKQFAPKD